MHIDLYMTVFLNQLGLISVNTSQKTVKYFLLDIIRNQKFEFLTKGQTETLSVRLLYEALDRNFSEVFSCQIFHNAAFAQFFCSELINKQKDSNTIVRFFFYYR